MEKTIALTFTLFFLILKTGVANFENETDISCNGKAFKNVQLAAYYANYEDEEDKDSYLDGNGKKLRSLQEYLDDQVNFITLAMDMKLGIPYGTKVCIPELNKHFGHRLKFEVRDSGSDLVGMGYLRADIFVRTEIDSYDTIVNRKATLVFEK